VSLAGCGISLALNARSTGGDWSAAALFCRAVAWSLAQALAMSWVLGLAPGHAAEPWSAVALSDRGAPDPIRDEPRLEGVGVPSAADRATPFRLSPFRWSPAEGWSAKVSLSLDTPAPRAGRPDWLDEESAGYQAPNVGDAYLEWTLPHRVPLFEDTTVRVGQFWSLLGAGMIDTTGPASIFRLGVPLSAGGVLATRPFGDRFSLTAGLVRSWDRLGGTPAVLAVANATWTVDWRLVLEGNLMWDPEPRSALQVADVFAMFYPVSSLTCFVDFNRGQEMGADPSQPATAWQAAAVVASYPFSRRGAVAVSGEWFRRAPIDGDSSEGTSWALTLSTTYDLTPHLFGELRYRSESGATQRAPLAREGRAGIDDIVEVSLVRGFD